MPRFRTGARAFDDGGLTPAPYPPGDLSPGANVSYVVCSRGTPIGTTTLGFVRIRPLDRMGWFFPNAEGERLMPVVEAMHRALHRSAQYVRRPDDAPPSTPHKVVVDVDDDLQRALDDVVALDLTLQREDGTSVPIESASISDTQTVRELWDDDLMPEGAEDLPPWERDTLEEALDDALEEMMSEGLDEDVRRMLELDEHDDVAGLEALAPPTEWTPEVAPLGDERYQIYVRLLDPSDVP